MEENKFFRLVWRFNSLVFMVAGLLAIGMLGFAGYQMFQDVIRDRTTRDIVNLQEEQTVDERWELGYMQNITGSPYVMVPLYSNQSYSQSYYNKSTDSIRNYLFIKRGNNEKHWLFPTNEYLILDANLLVEENSDAPELEVKAILYKVVEEDTNNDKRLTNEDVMVVALSKPDGQEYKKILSGVDVFVGHQLFDEDTMLIVYQRGNVAYSASVSLKDFSLSFESEIRWLP